MEERLFGFDLRVEEEHRRKYLVLNPSGTDQNPIIQYQVEMILNNKIPGLLNLDVRRKDDQTEICYSINGYTPLNVYLKQKKVSKSVFINFVEQLLNILQESNKYLLSEESFVLTDRYIYVGNDCQDVALLYIPVDVEQNINLSLKNLLIGLIAHAPGIDVQDPLMGSLLNYLKQENITSTELQKYIKQLRLNQGSAAPGPSISEPVAILQQQAANRVPTPPPEAVPPAQPVPGAPGIKGSLPKEPRQLDGNKSKKNIRTYILGAVAVIVLCMALVSVVKDQIELYLDSYIYIAVGALLILGSIAFVVIMYVKSKKEQETREVQEISSSLMEIQQKAGTSRGYDIAPPTPVPVQTCVMPEPVVDRKPSMMDDTTLLEEESDETELFDEQAVPVLKIMRSGQEEQIPINKPEFYLGRNKAVVDYCEESKNVGRVHAKIINQDGQYYIVDLDSKNGTYRNGERLKSNQPYLLTDNDKIKLANVEYIFNLN